MTLSLSTRVVDNGFGRALEAVLKLDKDVSPALLVIGDGFTSLVRKEFATATDPFGKKWIPLSKRRTREKRKRGFPLIPLTATGKMASSFTGAASAKQLVFGSDRTFPDGRDASSHQLGFTGSDGLRTPPRQMLPLSSNTLPGDWLRVVEKAFENLVKDI